MIVFFLYDMVVRRRNRNLVNNAAQSNAIVTSMFPGHFREKMITQSSLLINKNLKAYMNGDQDTAGGPMADLFISVTVIFADIVGFTA